MNASQIAKILSKYKVEIAGAGGLDSNCASALVRAGVVNLVIADFDIVSKITIYWVT